MVVCGALAVAVTSALAGSGAPSDFTTVTGPQGLLAYARESPSA